MRWLILLFLVSFNSWSQIECGNEERLLFQDFYLTPFMTSSERRNITTDLAKPVHEGFQNFKFDNPKVKISKIDILSCSSTLPLPAISKTMKPDPVEHINLAKQRMEKIFQIFSQPIDYTLSAGFRECGPPFNKSDLAYKQRVKVPGEPKTEVLYENAIGEVLGTEKLLETFKEFHLNIKSLEDVKALDPNPFVVKYRFFEGFRLQIWGKIPCQTPPQNKPSNGSRARKI